MLSELPNQVAQAWPPNNWCDVNLVVAVSGGADSVALLRVLTTLKQHVEGKGQIAIAHYNHRWRGEDSAEDAQWVCQLGEELETQVFLSTSPHEGERTEESLRKERRAFYKQVASDFGARYLATGHTASDQAETVLFRALRGSGLSGLSGIAQFAQLTGATSLTRPLLFTTRQAIVAYLKSIGQSWREDDTNQELGPTRNWLRHQLLPSIEDRIPASDAALCRLAKQASEANEVILQLASKLLDKSTLVDDTNKFVLNCPAFRDEPALVGREALRLAWQRRAWPEQAMTATHWQSLLCLTIEPAEPSSRTNPKRVCLPGGFIALRETDQLVLAPQEPKALSHGK